MRRALRLSGQFQRNLAFTPLSVLHRRSRNLFSAVSHSTRCRSSSLIKARSRGASEHSYSLARQDTSLVQQCSTADWNTPLCSSSATNGAVSVALGKFDGMHQGHRLLAERAAASGAHPHLLSFSGMAELLGWPARLPLVAPNDRARVLASWTPFCQGRTPRQRYIPFSMVRNLSPEDFVKVLAEDLQVSGVVVGQNYRFGYKAAGDSNMLLELGAKYGLEVDIVSLVEASAGGVAGQVSSSKIRAALSQGLMQQVSESLGRPYRLMANITPAQLLQECDQLRLQSNSLLNQPPLDNKMYQVNMLLAEATMPDQDTCSCIGELYVHERGLDLSKKLSNHARQNMRHGNYLVSFEFL